MSSLLLTFAPQSLRASQVPDARPLANGFGVIIAREADDLATSHPVHPMAVNVHECVPGVLCATCMLSVLAYATCMTVNWQEPDNSH